MGVGDGVGPITRNASPITPSRALLDGPGGGAEHAAAMQFASLEPADHDLVERARAVAERFMVPERNPGRTNRVGAAARAPNGAVFDGPNIRVPGTSPGSMCAEYVALACAYREGHQALEAVVAYYVSPSESRVIAPCGHCRELMLVFGDPWVIVATADGPRKIRLRDLHPLAPAADQSS